MSSLILNDGAAQWGNPLQVDISNISNPPTNSELNSIFGTAASVGSGFTSYIDDNDGNTNFYKVVSNGTSWWISSYTNAA